MMITRTFPTLKLGLTRTWHVQTVMNINDIAICLFQVIEAELLNPWGDQTRPPRPIFGLRPLRKHVDDLTSFKHHHHHPTDPGNSLAQTWAAMAAPTRAKVTMLSNAVNYTKPRIDHSYCIYNQGMTKFGHVFNYWHISATWKNWGR